MEELFSCVDVMAEIASHLAIPDLENLRATCRAWKTLLGPCPWRPVVERCHNVNRCWRLASPTDPTTSSLVSLPLPVPLHVWARLCEEIQHEEAARGGKAPAGMMEWMDRNWFGRGRDVARDMPDRSTRFYVDHRFPEPIVAWGPEQQPDRDIFMFIPNPQV